VVLLILWCNVGQGGSGRGEIYPRAYREAAEGGGEGWAEMRSGEVDGDDG
jgi:hypothetical protein